MNTPRISERPPYAAEVLRGCAGDFQTVAKYHRQEFQVLPGLSACR
ncbi:MAG: hypothetical protein WCQ21_09145 [Verrucomicrobiota bacterium]